MASSFFYAVFAVVFWEAAFVVGTVAFVVGTILSAFGLCKAYQVFNKIMEY